MKKVLQLSNYYYPEVGGIEKIAQSISNAIKDDCEVKVVCFTHKKDDRTDEVDGVQITRFGTKLFIASQQLSFSIMGNLKTIIADYNPDIIIIHMPNPFLCWLLLRYVKPGQKVIVYWHSDIVKQKVGNAIFKPLITKLLERSEKIFCTSPNYIDGSEYLSRYRKKCVVVPNCIEEDSLQLDSEAEEKIKEIKEQFPDKIICVGIGRQVPYKGFEYIVQAMKLLDDRFELFLLGRKGESTDKIVQLSQGMKNIHMVGEVSDIERKAYLAACDIFCFPSITKNEAFGIALAEGMYFDKPAITFTIPGSGVNYVSIHKKTGLEVPNRNVKAYAKAMKYLADHKDKREEYGKQAGERVRELFLYSEFKENIKKAIAEV